MMRWIRKQLGSLKVQLLWPVMLMMAAMVTILTIVVTRTYTSSIFEQEDVKVQSSFTIASSAIESLLDSAMNTVSNLMQNEHVQLYAAGKFPREVDRVLARQALLEDLDDVLAGQPYLHGMLFIRENGSAFGLIRYRTFFLDDDSSDILNKDMLESIYCAARGRTLWFGPIPGEELYGMERLKWMPDKLMLGVSVRQSLSYGKIYAVAVMDAAQLNDYVNLLDDGRSSIYLTNASGQEIASTDDDMSAEIWASVISENAQSGMCVNKSELNERVYVNYQRIESLGWTLIRELPMAEHDRTLWELRRTALRAAAILLAATLCVYLLWLRGFVSTFDALRTSIDRLRQGGLKERLEKPFAITEFEEIRQEFNEMSVALEQLMDNACAMERQQLELELRSLQTQLSPHMIFNSITAIRWMATMSGADRISDMLMELSEMLRPVFRDWAIEWTLGEELLHLGHYSNLLDLRYGNNFSIAVEVPEALYSVRLPRFTLQPLIENSCEHGGVSSAMLHVFVRAWTEGDRIVISVRDDGVGIPQETIDHIRQKLAERGHTDHVGLYSVYNRIRICMGAESRLEVFNLKTGGTEVIVSWPITRKIL